MLSSASDQGERGFDQFLAELLSTETGIFPSKFNWYVENLNKPVVRSVRVTAPGRVFRDRTGQIETECISVRAYFTNLGVFDLFDPHDPRCLRLMQYRAINALGFVGYQIGEGALIDSGYYIPARVAVGDANYESYYSGEVDPTMWSNGKRAQLYAFRNGTKTIFATDVNRWEGRFTGQEGVVSLEHLKNPELQERVIRRIIDRNLVTIESGLRQAGTTLREAAKKLDASVASVIAMAHLGGPFAALAALGRREFSSDEIGTSLQEYLNAFRSFETPYDHI